MQGGYMFWKKTFAFLAIFVLVSIFLGLATPDLSSAQTVPTMAPTTVVPPPEEPVPTPKSKGAPLYCVKAPLSKEVEVELSLLRFPETRNKDIWGGVINPPGTACDEAVEIVCKIPVRYLPQRSQLNYWREALEVRQYVKGVVDDSQSCRPKKVYFELTWYERWVHDKMPERFGFFWFNPNKKEWQSCEDVSFEPEVGKYGRISCSTLEWGYFTLGWKPPKNK